MPKKTKANKEPKPEVKSWIVRVRCEVTKEVVTSDCAEEQARSEPWSHADNEREIAMTDWEVTSVDPND